MKLNKKNSSSFVLILILSLMVCTLTWFLIEQIFTMAGLSFSLSVGPIGFDISVLAVYIRFNPGTVLGLPAGYFIFKSL